MGVFIFGVFVFTAAVIAALARVGNNIPEFMLVTGAIIAAYGAGRIGEPKDAEDTPTHR